MQTIDVDTYLTGQGKSSKADCIACDEKRSTGLLNARLVQVHPPASVDAPTNKTKPMLVEHVQ